MKTKTWNTTTTVGNVSLEQKVTLDGEDLEHFQEMTPENQALCLQFYAYEQIVESGLATFVSAPAEAESQPLESMQPTGVMH